MRGWKRSTRDNNRNVKEQVKKKKMEGDVRKNSAKDKWCEGRQE